MAPAYIRRSSMAERGGERVGPITTADICQLQRLPSFPPGQLGEKRAKGNRRRVPGASWNKILTDHQIALSFCPPLRAPKSSAPPADPHTRDIQAPKLRPKPGVEMFNPDLQYCNRSKFDTKQLIREYIYIRLLLSGGFWGAAKYIFIDPASPDQALVLSNLLDANLQNLEREREKKQARRERTREWTRRKNDLTQTDEERKALIRLSSGPTYPV